MAVEIKMPQLSDTMSSGKILTWKKKEGEKVSRGDILAEVETDKANLEIESFFQGTLLKILVPENNAAKVGELIAMIGEPGEAVASAPAQAAAPAAQPAPAAQAQPAPAVQHVAPPPPPVQQPVQHAAPQPAPAHVNGAYHGQDTGDRIKASPLARKMAEQHNIDLANLRGSGPNGRIVKKDIEQAAQGGGMNGHAAPTRAATPAYGAPAPQMAREQAPAGPGTMTPLSKMREAIARRMQQTITEVPHFYVTTSVDMGQVLSLRETLKEKPEFKGVSVNHFVIKAVAYALRHEPRVNRAFKDGQLYTPPAINVGIITAVDDGLLIPVIRDTDTLSLKDLVFEAKAAVERARAGRPNSSDLSGGTFSISNMGMFDVENFTAIINPGQGGVLAVSSVRDEPVVKNGQIVPGKRMKVTLSVDHRIIDGVMGANWLKFFKEGLENPVLLFV